MRKRDLGVEHVVAKLKRRNQVRHPALVLSVVRAYSCGFLVRPLIVDAKLNWGDPHTLLLQLRVADADR